MTLDAKSRSRLSTRTLLVGAAVGSLVAATTGTALARPGRAATTTPTQRQLFDVSVPHGSSDAFALGRVYTSTGLTVRALRWHAGKWTVLRVPQPKNGSIVGIAAASASSVFILATGQGANNSQVPVVYHWASGTKFTAMTLHGAGSATPQAIAASSPSDVWITGEKTASPYAPYALHWNGHAWKVTTVNGNADSLGFVHVSTSGPRNAWAMTGGTVPQLFHWNGNAWNHVNYTPPNGGVLFAIATSDSSHAWAIGSYSKQISTNQYLQQPMSIVWNGSKWRSVSVPGSNKSIYMTDVASAGSTAYAGGSIATASVDSHPFAVRFTSGKWHTLTTAHPGASSFFNAVSASSKLVLAVGNWNSGNPCTTPAKQLAEKLNGSSWGTTSVPNVVQAGSFLRATPYLPGRPSC